MLSWQPHPLPGTPGPSVAPRTADAAPGPWPAAVPARPRGPRSVLGGQEFRLRPLAAARGQSGRRLRTGAVTRRRRSRGRREATARRTGRPGEPAQLVVVLQGRRLALGRWPTTSAWRTPPPAANARPADPPARRRGGRGPRAPRPAPGAAPPAALARVDLAAGELPPAGECRRLGRRAPGQARVRQVVDDRRADDRRGPYGNLSAFPACVSLLLISAAPRSGHRILARVCTNRRRLRTPARRPAPRTTSTHPLAPDRVDQSSHTKRGIHEATRERRPRSSWRRRWPSP